MYNFHKTNNLLIISKYKSDLRKKLPAASNPNIRILAGVDPENSENTSYNLDNHKPIL